MRIGILGAGKVAQKMMKTVNAMVGIDCVAVASRDLTRATHFAEAFGVERAYGSYLELVEDRDVDVIYIATPHSHHYEHMQLCIQYKKHILCEKAFTVNATQAKSVLEQAKKKRLLVLEGMWTRFLPMAQTLREVILSQKVGDAMSMQMSICHNNLHNERVYSPALAGGTLLNLSVYALNFASMFFGDNIKSIQGTAMMTNTGVDGHNAINISYENGKMVTIHASSLSLSPGEAMIYCEQGYISIPRAEKLEEIFVFDAKHQLVERYKAPPMVTGFEYQLQAMKESLESGQLECGKMPHSATIAIMEQMDSLRKDWGLVYPCE